MAAPKYNSSNYDAAADKFTDLQDKYTGEAGWQLAEQQSEKSADKIAANAGSIASAEASRAARAAGAVRGQSAIMGANHGALAAQKTYSDAYTNARGQALQNNQNTMNSQYNLLQGAQQKDTNQYTSDSNRYNATMGAIGGAALGVAKALSDGDSKCIQDRTNDVETRRQELLARLRGEQN